MPFSKLPSSSSSALESERVRTSGAWDGTSTSLCVVFGASASLVKSITELLDFMSESSTFWCFASGAVSAPNSLFGDAANPSGYLFPLCGTQPPQFPSPSQQVHFHPLPYSYILIVSSIGPVLHSLYSSQISASSFNCFLPAIS